MLPLSVARGTCGLGTSPAEFSLSFFTCGVLKLCNFYNCLLLKFDVIFNSLQIQCTVQCVEQLWSQAAWWLLYSSAAGHWRPPLQERPLPASQCALLWTLPHLSWSSLWKPGPCQYASGGKDGHHYCYSKPKHNYMYLPLHVHVSLLLPPYM